MRICRSRHQTQVSQRGPSQQAKPDNNCGRQKLLKITFIETVKFQGQDIRVDYRGKVAGDEIKFTRTVAESIKEELVARRVKETNAR